MNIVFMGTPDIAATSLAALLAAGHHIAAVYTRPDKPVGRKQVLTAPPVKQLALRHGIPVQQPLTLRDEAAAKTLAAYQPDIAVVVAYGLLLPPAVLAAPKHGCVNMHVSLLPNYRGAAPVQWAVIHGEAETGVSVMQMDEGLDTGPVYAARRIAIGENDTAGEVLATAAAAGAALLCDILPGIAAGSLSPTPQQGEASWAPPLKKSDGAFSFDAPAQTLHNLARGCSPWPYAAFQCDGKTVKAIATRVRPENGAPGTVLSTKPLVVACGEGALELAEVLPEGSSRMTGAQWAAGRRFAPGDRIG